MKFVKIIALILLVAFVGIQFVPTKRNQSNTVPKSDFMTVEKVPDDIQSLVKESCYDCHSNNTDYPWYNKIQPAAWFLEDHITKGKKELNFNDWGNYSDRRKNSKLNAMIHEIEDEEMPLSSYTFIHGNAKLSKEESQDLVSYLTILKKKLE